MIPSASGFAGSRQATSVMSPPDAQPVGIIEGKLSQLSSLALSFGATLDRIAGARSRLLNPRPAEVGKDSQTRSEPSTVEGKLDEVIAALERHVAFLKTCADDFDSAF